MITNTCPYCQTPFVGARRTKKWCSDNCRQMAYLSRKGYSFGGVNSDAVKHEAQRPVHLSTVKDDTVNVKADVKYSNDVKPDVKYGNDIKQDNVKQTPVYNSYQPNFSIEQLMKQMGELIENKIASALNTIRQEIATASNSGQIKDNPAVKLCSPCTINGISITSNTQTLNLNNVKHWVYSNDNIQVPAKIDNTTTIDETGPGLCNQTEEENNDEREHNDEVYQRINLELYQAEKRILQLEKELRESKEQLTETLSALPQNNTTEQNIEETEEEETEVEESEEQTVEGNQTEIETQEIITVNNEAQSNTDTEQDKYFSGGIPKINYLINRELERGHDEYRFHSPLDYWNVNEVINITWVSVRLRCLFVSLVKASHTAKLPNEAFINLANAFIKLHNSRPFQELPSDYPYIHSFSEVTNWLSEIAAKRKNNSEMIFFLTPKRKAQIVAICNELESCTDKVKFSELNFDDIISTPQKRQWAVRAQNYKTKTVG